MAMVAFLVCWGISQRRAEVLDIVAIHFGNVPIDVERRRCLDRNAREYHILLSFEVVFAGLHRRPVDAFLNCRDDAFDRLLEQLQNRFNVHGN
jgi:hypothetical protein